MKIVKKLLIAMCMCVALCVCAPNVLPVSFGCITTEAASKVKLNKKKVTLYVGNTTTLKLKGTTQKIKWSSSNKSIATVSSKGKVKAKKAGTATITAKVGKKKYKCKVSVKDVLSVNTTNITIKDSGKIYVKLINPYATATWSTQNDDIVSLGWDQTPSGKNTYGLNIVAKKNGVANVILTNNINSKKVTIKVIVSGYVEPIVYIADRSVEYDSIGKEHRLFFSLQTADYKRVASSGVANIKIVNDDGVEVYNKAVSFDESNFANWTNASYGTRYLCCIKIPESELVKSTATNGKLTFSVKLNNGGGFNESTHYISQLPLQDLKEVCKVTLPETPINISSFSYSGSRNTECIVSDVTYSVKKSYTDGLYIITFEVSGEKIYDAKGDNYSRSCAIGYKLYKGDIVAKTGTINTVALETNEKFVSECIMYEMEAGDYKLEFLDVK